MAVITIDDMLSRVKSLIGERTDDEAIQISEDFSDTLEGLRENVDWKSKYTENDNAWRKKYRDRFFGAGDGDSNENGYTEKQSNTATEVVDGDDKGYNRDVTFDDLFEED